MNFIAVSEEEFKDLQNKLDGLSKKIDSLSVSYNKPKWYNTEQVCQYLRISKRCLSNYVSQGKLKASKISGLNYFLVEDIDKLLEENYG